MLAAICPAQPRDIVAKDQIVYRILLSLYFTIFLNQLDNLFPYTENGTIRPRSGLIGDSFSWLVEEIVMFGRVSADGFSRLLARHSSKGGGLVACAAAMPLAVLALAVTADYAKVSHFRDRVQRATDAASVAAAEAVARQPDIAADNDVLAGQVADVVFLDHAPRGAGTPTVALKSSAAAVTATVGYAGLAPSNFGSVLGYDAVSADASSTSLARVADFRPTVTR
jgi:Flp pilus assembly protein TadG